MIKKMFIVAGMLYIIFGLLAQSASAQDANRHSVIQIQSLYRCDPPDSALSPNPATFTVSYDQKYLYVDAVKSITEPFEKGHFTTKDKWLGETDYLRIQLITDPNSYSAYLFYAFPLGNRYDAMRNRDHEIDAYWDSFYSYTSTIKNGTWHVSMKIPFKDLRISGNAPYQWNIIASHYNARAREVYSDRFLTTEAGYDYFRLATPITIPTEISHSISLYLRPYVIAKYNTLDDEMTFDEENLGIDFSLKPTSSSLLKASVNPDFTDVPMDDQDDIYNLKYVKRYDENRYFFIDDDNYFGVDPEIFYSRNILQPQYALRYTIKEQKYSFGALFTQDKNTSESNDDTYGIIAFKPYNSRYSCQITGLTRFNSDTHNELLHLNPTARLSRHLYLDADFNYSYKDTKGEKEQTGYYSFGGMHWLDRDFTLSAQVTQMSKDYQADMGYIEETNLYGWSITATKSKRFRRSLFKEMELTFGTYDMLDNDTSASRKTASNLRWEAETRIQSNLGLEGVHTRELYEGRYFEHNDLTADFYWHQLRALKLRLNASYASSLNYYLCDVYDNFSQHIGLEGEFSRYISYKTDINHITYYDLPQFSKTYFDNDYWLGNLDLTLNLSNRLSFTNGVRYNNYQRFSNEQYIGYYCNLRWEYRPGSYLFAGYKLSEDEIDNSFVKSLNQTYLKITYLY